MPIDQSFEWTHNALKFVTPCCGMVVVAHIFRDIFDISCSLCGSQSSSCGELIWKYLPLILHGWYPPPWNTSTLLGNKSDQSREGCSHSTAVDLPGPVSGPWLQLLGLCLIQELRFLISETCEYRFIHFLPGTFHYNKASSCCNNEESKDRRQYTY